ncbi:hypothetical protein ACEPAI_9395 [Sanghuangporus weigelae]
MLHQLKDTGQRVAGFAAVPPPSDLCASVVHRTQMIKHKVLVGYREAIIQVTRHSLTAQLASSTQVTFCFANTSNKGGNWRSGLGAEGTGLKPRNQLETVRGDLDCSGQDLRVEGSVCLGAPRVGARRRIIRGRCNCAHHALNGRNALYAGHLSTIIRGEACLVNLPYFRCQMQAQVQRWWFEAAGPAWVSPGRPGLI